MLRKMMTNGFEVRVTYDESDYKREISYVKG